MSKLRVICRGMLPDTQSKETGGAGSQLSMCGSAGDTGSVRC